MIHHQVTARKVSKQVQLDWIAFAWSCRSRAMTQAVFLILKTDGLAVIQSTQSWSCLCFIESTHHALCRTRKSLFLLCLDLRLTDLNLLFRANDRLVPVGQSPTLGHDLAYQAPSEDIGIVQLAHGCSQAVLLNPTHCSLPLTLHPHTSFRFRAHAFLPPVKWLCWDSFDPSREWKKGGEKGWWEESHIAGSLIDALFFPLGGTDLLYYLVNLEHVCL